MKMRQVLLSCALGLRAVSGDWCSDKETGYHCRDDTGREKFCKCTQSIGNGEDGLLSPSYICYGDGEEVQCPGGCFKNSHTGTQGMCEAGGCGEAWELDKISEWRTTLCPMVTYNSFERTMSEPQVTENLLKLTEDNNNWFSDLMHIFLYQPAADSPRVNRQFNGEVVVDLPPTLAALAVEGVAAYNRFGYSRNLIKCEWGNAQIDECVAQCEDVSQRIGRYSEECESVYASEQANLVPEGTPACDLDPYTEPWYGADCPPGCTYTPATIPTCDLDPITDGTSMCPGGCEEVMRSTHTDNEGVKTDIPASCTGTAHPLINARCEGTARRNTGRVNFNCFTLRSLPSGGGQPGCAEPWCQRSSIGSGIRGQGWRRNCNQLCTESVGTVQTAGASTAGATALALAAALAVIAM